MNNQPITVIHHSADYDGIFCREIARKFWPNATLIGWDFKDPKIAFPAEGQVYVLDLPPECFEEASLPNPDVLVKRLIWIDHHKTAIERWNPQIPGYRIDGVAACRLAWQWFSSGHGVPLAVKRFLPEKQDFINRKVLEPLAVRLAGEYDIWDKRDPNAELFQCGLRGVEIGEARWMSLLDLKESESATMEVLDAGRPIQFYCRNQDASVIQNQGFDLDWEGFRFLALNSARCNSLSFLAGLKPEHDGCLAFKWTGKGWMVSLYGCPGKPDNDFSVIATKYGGGGHKQACGFTCKTLPFSI